MSTWLQEFGREVRRLRGLLGLTQIELGRKCGVSRVTINKIEMGRSAPNVELVAALSNALGGLEINVRGFRLGGPQANSSKPGIVAKQLVLPLDIVHRFRVASLTLDPLGDSDVSMTLHLAELDVA